MKKLISLSTIFLVSLLSACSSPKYTISTDITKYVEYIANVSFSTNCVFFPNLDDIPDTAAISVKYIERTAFMARSKNLMLTLSFSENDYFTYKDNLFSNYVFLNDPVIDDDEWVRIPEVEFNYSHLTIRVVDNDDFYYPMNFGMIGFSDDNYEIVLFMYFDSERDGITDMNKFMETEFPLN